MRGKRKNKELNNLRLTYKCIRVFAHWLVICVAQEMPHLSAVICYAHIHNWTVRCCGDLVVGNASHIQRNRVQKQKKFFLYSNPMFTIHVVCWRSVDVHALNPFGQRIKMLHRSWCLNMPVCSRCLFFIYYLRAYFWLSRALKSCLVT